MFDQKSFVQNMSEPVGDEMSTRQRLAWLEREVGKLPDLITHWDLDHTFTKGVYARTLRIKANTVIVGKIHRHEHFNFLQSGTVTVFSSDGRETLTGPKTMVSSAGVKRAVYAHTDAVWTTIHDNPLELRDLAEIEKYVIAESWEQLDVERQAKIGVTPEGESV